MDPTIDIFRDPVYEEMGFIFDPDRNQYFEIIDHPEYGEIRSYISPREDGPVPELSEARMLSDIAASVGSRSLMGGEKRRDGVSDRSLSIASRIAQDILSSDMGRVTPEEFDRMTKSIVDRMRMGSVQIIPEGLEEEYAELKKSLLRDRPISPGGTSKAAEERRKGIMSLM